VAQIVECLPSKHEALSLNFQTAKLLRSVSHSSNSGAEGGVSNLQLVGQTCRVAWELHLAPEVRVIL
jgi:hypothetical protein